MEFCLVLSCLLSLYTAVMSFRSGARQATPEDLEVTLQQDSNAGVVGQQPPRLVQRATDSGEAPFFPGGLTSRAKAAEDCGVSSGLIEQVALLGLPGLYEAPRPGASEKNQKESNTTSTSSNTRPSTVDHGHVNTA